MAGQKSPQILTAADFTAGLQTKLVFDLVYNPVDTPLLRLARSLNLPVITGLEMFVQQGARQFEIWTGKPAPEEEMLRVVVHAPCASRAEGSSTGASGATENPAAPPEPPAPEPAALAARICPLRRKNSNPKSSRPNQKRRQKRKLPHR